MNRKWKRWIEFCVVLVLSTFGLWLTLPLFLRSQQSRTLLYIMNDLETVVRAVNAYRHDHDSLPLSFYPPALKTTSISLTTTSSVVVLVQTPMRPTNFSLDREMFNQQFKVLQEEGYLKSIPEYILQDWDEDDGSTRLDTSVLSRKPDESSEGERENWALIFRWPLAEVQTNNEFNNAFINLLLKQPVPAATRNDYSQPLLHTNAYYAPSNGLHSAGYVYCDVHGNQSPLK